MPAPRSESTGLVRRDFVLALVLFVLSLALYSWTACPSLFVGDTPEIATAIALRGVPHPPGYPLFTHLSATLFDLVPSSLADDAGRANLVASFYGALGISLAFLFVRRLGQSVSAALFVALALATGRTYWGQSLAAEVYTFDACLLLTTLHVFLSLRSQPERRQWFLVLGVCVGAWVGHRSVNVLLVVPLAVSILHQTWNAPQRVALWSRAVGAAFVTLVAGWLGLFLTSLSDPALDIGDPETPGRLFEVVRGAPYSRHLGDGEFAQNVHRFGRFLKGTFFGMELGLAGLLALLGWRSARRDARTRPLMNTLGFALFLSVGFAVFYAVLDIEVFFLPAWILLALCAGFGWDALTARVAQRSTLLISAALMLGNLGALLNFETTSLRNHKLTRIFADGLLESLPENALFFVHGDTSIHSAWYLQAVENKREDVAIISLGHTLPWYVDGLRERHPELVLPDPTQFTSPSAFSRAVMLANIESRAVCVSPSIETSVLLAPDGERGFQLYTRGLVRQVYYTGQSFDLKERVTWNLEFLGRLRTSLGTIPEEPDMDSRSTLAQFALCLFLNGEHARLGRWPELERRSLEACLEFHPDDHELAIQEDVRTGLGFTIPLNRFGARARERLAELGGSGG